MQHTLTVDYNNGVRAGTGTGVRILDFSGLESLPVETNLIENAMIDGGFVASVRVSSRRITFMLDFIETSLGWADIPRLFPKGVARPLDITRDGVERTIIGVRDGELVPLGNRGAGDPVQYMITFLCPDPYMKQRTETQVIDVGVEGGLEYPIAFEPVTEFETMDSLSDSVELHVHNDGDYPVGFVLDIVAHGTVAPVITIGRDSMTFSDIESGDRLVIDTTRQTIKLNGENGFDVLESGEFLQIPRGDSSVFVSNLVGVAMLTFTPVYEGV